MSLSIKLFKSKYKFIPHQTPICKIPQERLDRFCNHFARMAELLPPKPKPLNYKVGQDLYSLSIDDDGKCGIDTYRISRINENGVYAILVAPYTWGNRAAIGKTFSKTKDYGWLKNIPSWCRYHARTGERLFHTTVRAAWADKDTLKYVGEDDNDPVRIRASKTIKAMLAKLKAAKPNKR